ncbi:MAG: glycerophosphodiester phosphodiesterase [Gallionella sp.]
MLKKTQIFAHRGANRLAAENTRTAFDLALNDEISGIETDVQLSRDAVPVLWHDDDLGKLGLPEKHVDDFDFEELRGMNFAAHFLGNTQVESVMQLKDFIERYRSRTRLLLEIKNRNAEPTDQFQLKVRHTLALARARNGDEIMVSSFHLDSLIYAHQCAPHFPLIFNMEPEHKLADIRTALDEQTFLYGFCLHISRLDADTVNLLRSHNKIIAVYTCNSDEEILRALNLEVDILISDIPQRALQLLANQHD